MELTVRNPINSLILDKDQTTILKDGYTSTVTATTDPANYDETNISWTIADTSIATVTVSGKTATIKATSKIGQTTLIVSAGGITKTVNVSVVNFVTTTYEYTGSVQQVDLPAGTYKLEVWGASGGTKNNSYIGGYGGYSQGILTVNANVIVYVVVGGVGSANSTGGYNGGGNGSTSTGSGGGGASHIGLKTGLLTTFQSDYNSKLLIVAGGGGGAFVQAGLSRGGHSGGFTGETITNQYDTSYKSRGGTQSAYYFKNPYYAGEDRVEQVGGFGFGGSHGGYSMDSGGGGGFYGGNANERHGSPGGGGSGYINTSKLTDAFMYGYNVSTSSATATKTYSTTNVSSTPTSNYAKSGDGAARITPIN